MSKADTLPNGWIRATLAELVRPREERTLPADCPNLPYLGMEQVEPRTTRIIGRLNASAVRSSCMRFYPGDVLYGRLRPYLNKVTAPDFEGLASAEFIVLPAIAGMSPSFLMYRLNSQDFVEFANSLNSGDRPRVSFAQIGKFPLKLPPVNEQARIVAKLKELLAELDAGVARLQTIKTKLVRYRKCLLKSAVEGRLTRAWREQRLAQAEADGSPLESGEQLLRRSLKKRRQRWEEKQLAKYQAQGKQPPEQWRDDYPEPVEPDTGKLAALPEGWCWATLDQLGDIASGVTKGSKYKEGIALKEVPYLRVANVHRGYLGLGEMKTLLASAKDVEELALQPGDILFSGGGDLDKLGRGWVWEGQLPLCIHQNHVFRVRLHSDDMFPKFVSHHGNSFGQQWFLENGKHTTNLASINLSILRSFPVPLPPVEEQREIMRVLDEAYKKLEDQENKIQQKLVLCEPQRQTILNRAFDGKLVPQDAEEETSSVLLERLRRSHEERAAQPRPKRKPEIKQAEEKRMKSILEVLPDTGEAMSAADLLNGCGLGSTSTTADIEKFYIELRKLVDKQKLISVERKDMEDYVSRIVAS